MAALSSRREIAFITVFELYVPVDKVRIRIANWQCLFPIQFTCVESSNSFWGLSLTDDIFERKSLVLYLKQVEHYFCLKIYLSYKYNH